MDFPFIVTFAAALGAAEPRRAPAAALRSAQVLRRAPRRLSTPGRLAQAPSVTIRVKVETHSVPVTTAEGCRILFLVGELHTGGLERQLYYLLRAMDRARHHPRLPCGTIASTMFMCLLSERSACRFTRCPARNQRLEKLPAFRRLVKGAQPGGRSFLHVLYELCGSMGGLWHQRHRRGSVRNAFQWSKEDSGALVGRLSARWPRHQICNSVAAAESGRKCRSVFAAKAVRRRPKRAQSREISTLGLCGRRACTDPGRRLSIACQAVGTAAESGAIPEGEGSGLQGSHRRRGAVEIVPGAGSAEPRGGRPCRVSSRTPITFPCCWRSRHSWSTPPTTRAVRTPCMEAMACGRAVVATDAGDVPALVDNGRTGFVVSSNDEPALAEHILQVDSRSRVVPCAWAMPQGRKRNAISGSIGSCAKRSDVTRRPAGKTDCRPKLLPSVNAPLERGLGEPNDPGTGRYLT